MAKRLPPGSLITGRITIGGPAGKAPGGGPKMSVGQGDVTKADHDRAYGRTRRGGSKKGSAGTRAGLGRPTTKNGPHPTGHAGTPFKSVQGKKPSLMTRIGNRIGRYFGFKPPRPKPQ
jgi:hypothetical protein